NYIMSAIGEHIFHGLILSFLLIGIWDVTLNYEKNKCEMTYMWEMPTYKQIHLGENVSKLYPDYSLYVYAEGEYRIRELEKNKFKGVPVLFIPGHGGSHEQARSLGSVLLRKAISSSTTFHFDVFTVDFSWPSLGKSQKLTMLGLPLCIEKILSLYKNDPKPNSVAIVGHSMGGVIARGLFTIPQFNHDLVKTIILLATPAIAPVLNADQLHS
uniref:GPI inositol-deacylase n=1 Tax=Ciona savignyi TaxID=51511 RepID=H2Z5S7_CIOSA